MYDMNDNRINARVDSETTRRLDELAAATGQSVSQVVREAIAVYHAQLEERQRPRPRHLLSMVGKYSSEHGDGSTRYKEIIGEVLEEKWARTQSSAPPSGTKPRRKAASR
jgi:hypothetical protein